ncbi:MAG: PKD domain-containing protein [Ignavibacteriae bacterium]|nr:PKD domain-containing protein [Ignavibacteriota bacterium]
MKLKIFTAVTIFSYILLSNFFENKLYENDESKINTIRTSSPKASIEMKKERKEYFERMLMDPITKKIPRGIRQKELAFAKGLQDKSNGLKKNLGVESLDWKEAGPNNVGGRTRALAVDITNPNTILAGGASGGVWKSTDKGASWQMKSTTLQVLSVTSLAQDPRSGKTNTWYYGTGEFKGSAGDQGYTHTFSGDGIYKSVDNGETWKVLNSTFSANVTQWDSPFDFVSKIEISPVTGSIIIATNGIGIFRSSDEGNTFTLGIGGSGHHFTSDLSIAKNGTIVAVLSSPFQGQNPDNSPGVYKSTDDGVSWINITPTTFPQMHERSEVEIAPSNPNIAYIVTYVGVDQNTQKEDIRLHKINISNGTSEDRTNNLPVFNSPFGGEEQINTQGGYNLTLAIKPDNENFVLIGSTNLFKSDDGFSTKPNDAKLDWIGGYHPTYFGYPNFHPDIHSYSFEANNPKAMWWGHDGGLSYTSDITNTNYSEVFPWENKNNGYNITQFYHITISKNSGDNRIMGGTQDNGTPYFIFDGVIGQQIADVSSGDGAHSYFGQNYAYTSVYNGIVTRLGYDNNNNPNLQFGYTEFTPTNASGQLFINPFSIDPNDENIIYYPAGNSLWRNNQLNSIPENQQGTSVGWSKLDNLSLPSGFVITTISVSESNPNHRIYYGGIDYSQQSSGASKIYKLDNANTANNGAVELTIPGIAQWSFPNFIAINPDNANEIIVVFSNYNIVGVYHSLNGGQSFTAIEGNLQGNETLPGPSTRSAVILPSSNGTQYFLATSTGVYSATNLDGANTVWNLEGGNTIGNVVVNSLAARKSDGKIVAGTHGRGAFAATAGSTSGTAIAAVNVNTLSLQSRPGESGSTNFTLSNSGDGPLNFNVSVTGNFGSNLSKTAKHNKFKSVNKEDEEYLKFIKGSKSRYFTPPNDNSKKNKNIKELFSLNGNDYIFHDDGDSDADGFIGDALGFSFDWMSEFDVSGFEFEAEVLEFYIRSEDELLNSISAGIYDKDFNLIQYGDFFFDKSKDGAWFSATLNPAIKFSDGDKFYVELYSYGQNIKPAGVDVDATVPNKGYFYDYTTATWQNLNTQSGLENGAFLIRAKGTQTGGANQNPTAIATVSKNQASVNESITFDGSQSYDNDGQISNYFWEFGDGSTSTQQTATHSYSQANTYTYSLTVTDNKGATGKTTGQITVGSNNQNLVSVNPANGTIQPGGSQNITLTLDAQNLNIGNYTGVVTISTNGGNLVIPIDYLVSVESISNIPNGFYLSQNYPNPFNPSTTIEYSIPNSQSVFNNNVELKIYDLLGREIKTIVNQKQSPGIYQAKFDAAEFKSGVYVYRLTYGNYNESKKMILIK